MNDISKFAADPQYVDIAAGWLKALANARRRATLQALLGRELHVNALAATIGMSQSALSQHLAVLRTAQIVRRRRDAQTIYYSLNEPLASSLLKLVQDVMDLHP